MTKKILIVDDDVDVISIYKAILEKEGYSVIAAHNKVEGMQKALEEKPGIIVLDVMMTTHYEGFEMRQELQEKSELKDIPVLMQTSIDVLTTTDGAKESIQAMAREFRNDPQFKDLQVLLINNLTNDLKGVDYMNESGKNIYFEVDGYLKKPVKADQLIPEVKRLLN